MDLAKYLAVLVVLCLEGGETGGGGKHHNHVKIHIPEFIHHDHHKKVITIHHHHHKPKKEHHHHHHHHQKPHIPHGHHYQHHHKKTHTKTKTVSKGGHGHHGHQGHHKHHQTKHGHSGHHGHHGHHGYHGHHGHHGHGHHHEAPVVPPVSYNPIPVPSFEDDFGSSFSPAGPSFGGDYPNTGYAAPQIPQVHGVTHTVKQVKVYDTLPGALPNAGGSHGYEVTEEGDEGDDDVFTAVNGLHHTFPATYNYLRSAASQPATHDPFAELGPQSTVQAYDPFEPEPTSVSSGAGSFTGTVQGDPFASVVPTQHLGLSSAQPSAEFSPTFQADTGFDGYTNSYTGPGGDTISFASNEESSLSEETPVSFAREAGIQESSKTGNVETIVY